MIRFVFFSCLLFPLSQLLNASDIPHTSSNMFSLTTEEMLFASKLSDINRRLFCYTFSMKERSLVMKENDPSLNPDQKVEKVLASLEKQGKPSF